MPRFKPLLAFAASALAVAVLAPAALAQPGCLCVLNPAATHALEVNGGSIVKLTDGPIIVNSNAKQAIEASGGSQVISTNTDPASPSDAPTPHIFSVGGVLASGGSTFSPAPEHISAPVADPFANTPVPTTTGGNMGSGVAQGNQVLNLSPGTYSQIGAGGNGEVKLKPGVYVVTGSFFNSGNGYIHGSGVEIFMAKGASVHLSGGSTTELVAPDRGNGAFNEIVFFFDRSSTAQFKVDDVASALFTGSLYGKSASLVVQRLRVVAPRVVFDNVTVHSGGRFTLD